MSWLATYGGAVGWTREVYELPEDHGWTARPGHKILVLDAGAVVVEYPGDWVVEPSSDQIDIRDRATQEEGTCVLAVSCLRLPPRDWSDLPLSRLLLEASQGDDREGISEGRMIETVRDDVESAWTELRVVDPGERRQSRCRLALVRGRGVQCLITFDFWPEDAERLVPIWDGVLSSVRLAVSVEDPRRGRRIE